MYALAESLGACANGKCAWTVFTNHTPSLASGLLSPAMMEILPHQFTECCRVFHTGCILSRGCTQLDGTTPLRGHLGSCQSFILRSCRQ